MTLPHQVCSPTPSTFTAEAEEDVSTNVVTISGGAQRPLRPKTEPLWRISDAKAQKRGQRSTIYWVGKGIIGEDGAPTGERAKGASYHGEWGNNQKHGYGVQVFPSGEKYEGQWGEGMRHGEGTFWAPFGKTKKLRKVYVGGWKCDKRHGRGTCFFKNGEFFQGSWDQGKMHGHGTLRYANGDLYVGDWHQSLRSGKGTLNRANGDCYEGYWLDDKREGSGSFFYASSGKVFVGEWAQDLPKAGIYTQASPNPDQAGGVPKTSILQPVRLALPTEVLEGALAAVRNARRPFRAKNTPLDKMFSEEEISALRQAFECAQRSDGRAGFPEIQALVAQLGSDVPSEKILDLLLEAGLTTETSEKDVFIDLDEFLRFFALLIDDETILDKSQWDYDSIDGDWDEDPE